jgi:hypothetical protein
MPATVSSFLKKLGQSLLMTKEKRSANAERQRYVENLVEKIVDDIDPRLRALGGYRKKLAPCVEHMLTYGQEICSHLPGPIEFSEASCRSNATVRASFANYREMVGVFSRCREVQDFFRQHPAADHAFMVLGMKKTENRVFGMEQHGDIIRKDVPQVNVSFSDYRITHPSCDEESLRFNLRERALHECVAQTIKRLMQERNFSDEMQEHELKLKMQLGMLQNQHDGLMSLMNDDTSIVTKISEVKEQLGKVGHHLDQLKQDIGTLDAFLDKVAELLDRPSELLQVSTITFSLDRLNRLLEEGSAKESDRISLAQVEFGDNEKRVGLLASFPRKELVPVTKPGSISLA